MNSRQLQYAILLSETGNFSLVAEKLNISQPALSKQILNLETELGIQLFNRNNTSAILTAAGEHFIKEAKELIYKEKQLLRSMQMYKSGEKGKLVIGITPFRSSYLIPKITKQIRKKFPRIQIKLAEARTEILRKEAAEGKFDFAIINLPVDDSLFDVTLIEPDSLVLVVSEELLDNHPELKDKKEIDFKECNNIPFVVASQNLDMRTLFETLCIKADINPDIAAEVINLTTAWSMASCGVGATILPLQFVDSEISDKKLKIIKIKNTAYLRQPAILTRKGQYISEYAQYAIDLLTNKTK